MSENNPRIEQVLDGQWGADASSGDVWALDDALVPDWRPPAGGGGSQTAREALQGSDVVHVLDGGTAPLPWAKINGSDLLDLTDPLSPVVVTAGVYAFSVLITGLMMTEGGTFQAQLALDTAGANDSLTPIAPPATAANPSPITEVSATYYLPAGAIVQAGVLSMDGGQAIDFAIVYALLQRIS